MTTTTIILEVDHDKPIPDLLKLVEGRAYTLAGVKDTRARLVDGEIENFIETYESYRNERLACWGIAQRLDAFNPELLGAFTGLPSERIKRQLDAQEMKGFCRGDDAAK